MRLYLLHNLRVSLFQFNSTDISNIVIDTWSWISEAYKWKCLCCFVVQVLGAGREDGDSREGDRQVFNSPGAVPEARSDQRARDAAPRDADGQARLA